MTDIAKLPVVGLDDINHRRRVREVINQLLDQIVEGEFTGTLTGFTSPPSGTVKYRISNGIVTLWIDANIVGASNSTAMTMTGLPAAVQPTGTRRPVCSVQSTHGDGADPGRAVLTAGSSTMTFETLFLTGTLADVSYSPIGFSASAEKGLPAGWTITYPL